MTTKYSLEDAPLEGQLMLPWPVGTGTPQGARKLLKYCVTKRLPWVWQGRLRKTLMDISWNTEAVQAVELKKFSGRQCARVFAALVEDGGGQGEQAREILLVALWYSMELEAFSSRRWRKYRMALLSAAADGHR